jgi:hypothetical protein
MNAVEAKLAVKIDELIDIHVIHRPSKYSIMAGISASFYFGLISVVLFTNIRHGWNIIDVLMTSVSILAFFALSTLTLTRFLKYRFHNNAMKDLLWSRDIISRRFSTTTGDRLDVVIKLSVISAHGKAKGFPVISSTLIFEYYVNLESDYSSLRVVK